MKNKVSLPWLFWSFFKIGMGSFGGGWTMIVLVHREYVVNRKLISEVELNDLANVARSLPGTMICNYGMLLGCRFHGILGGILCTLGMALGPFLVMILVTSAYVFFRDNLYVAAAMSGVRAAIVPIIAASLGILRQGSFRLPVCFFVAFFSFFLFLFFNVSTVVLILAGAVCGLAASEYHERRNGGKDAVS